jgi:hypothetical protein
MKLHDWRIVLLIAPVPPHDYVGTFPLSWYLRLVASGKEAGTLLIFALLAEKWEKAYSQVCGHVNARMSIANVRGATASLPPRISHSDKQNKPPPRSLPTLAPHYPHAAPAQVPS